MKKLVVALFFLSLATPIYSQSTTGNIEGWLVGEKNERLSFANITVTSTDLLGTRGTTSNQNGYFNIQALPVGKYHVKISFIPYLTRELDKIHVALGATTSLGVIKLSESNIQVGEVIITAQQTNVDLSTTSNEQVFTNKKLIDLPLERNYQQISQLAPQANVSYYGDGISFLGASGKENKYFINGINVSEPENDWWATLLPYNFVKEIKVRSGGYEAEYEGSLGGVVEVLTNSGGNDFKIQLFSFFNNNKFSGERMSVGQQLPRSFNQYDFGFGAGGPVIKDKLWYYVSYNPQYSNEEMLVNGQGYRTLSNQTQIYSGKLSFLLDEKNRFEFSVFGDPGYSNGIPTWISASAKFLTVDEYERKTHLSSLHLNISGIHTISNTFLLESNFTLSKWNQWLELVGPNSGVPFFYDWSNQIVSGGSDYTQKDFDNKLIKVGLKATLLTGTHLLKAGIEFNRKENHDTYNEYEIDKYSDTDYAVIKNIDDGVVSQNLLTLFLSDSWLISPKLRLNYGLRWEPTFFYATNGIMAQKIIDQIAPRLGVIYTPDEYGLQKISFSAGRFYHSYALALARNFFDGAVIGSYLSYDHNPRINSNGGKGQSWSGVIYPAVEGLKGQYEDEISFAYENQITSNIKFLSRLTFRTLGMGIEHGIDITSGNYVFGNPGYGPMSTWPKMKRDYIGLELTLEKFYSDNFSFQISYTLSRLSGNFSGLYDFQGFLGPLTTQFDIPEQLVNGDGLLPYDRTHVLKIFGSYKFDFGLSAGFSFVWETGTPLSVYGGYFPGFPTAYGFLSQRGTAGRTPNIWDLNLRFVYNISTLFNLPFETRLIADVFHFASDKIPVMFEEQKFFGIDDKGNQIDPNPNYGMPKKYQSPMSLRFGIEISF